MPVTLKDIYKLMDDADYHARAVTRLNTEIRSLLSTISIPDKPAFPCPSCGLDLHGERALAAHLANVHDGPAVPFTPEEQLA